MMNQLPNALAFSHQLLEQAVSPGDNVLDGTIGNGHDTLFLANLVGQTGTVYGFDIQPQAILTTKQRLTAHHLMAANIHLFQESHAKISEILPEKVKLKAAIFNLGYLPGSDKQITTQATSTISAIKACLSRLATLGMVVIVVYYGHPGGEAEKSAVVDFVSALDQQKYTVLSYRFLNQKHTPPFVLAIQRKSV